MAGLIVPGVAPRCGAALAVDPAAVAVRVVLFFPDRHAVLDRIDDVAAGIEGLAPMLGADADPDRHLADAKIADPVQAPCMLDGEALEGLTDDAFAFPHRERLESLVFQALHGKAFVKIAHPAFEADIAAGAAVQQRRTTCHGVDRRLREVKIHASPPRPAE